MSTIKINQLATRENLLTTDLIAVADSTGLADKIDLDALQSFLNTIGVSGYQGVVLAADATVSADGIYVAGDSGTYTNNGGIVVDLTNSFTLIDVSATQTVFTKIEIPLGAVLETTFDNTNNNDGATMKAIDDYIKSEYQEKTQTQESYSDLNRSGGATEITNGFQIPIGSTGNNSYWFFYPKIFELDNTLQAGNKLRWIAKVNITNYAETTQPNVFQGVWQQWQNGVQVGTFGATEVYDYNVSGSDQEVTITCEYTFTQSDVDNGYYYRFYLGFLNSASVTSAVDVTLTSLVYENDVLLKTLIDRNKNTLSKRAVKPSFKEITVNRSTDRKIIQNTIDDNIDNVNEENPLEIKAIGIHEAIIDSQYIYDADRDYYQVVNLRDYIDLIGEGKEFTFIIGKLDPNLGTSFPYEKYQGVYIDSISNLKRLSVIFQTGRYALHIDGGFAGRLANTKQVIEDCLFWHQGNTGNALTRWGIGTAFGHGTNSGQETILQRCVFKNPQTGIYIHNNYEFDKPSITRYLDCEVVTDENNDDGNIVVENFGSGVNDILEIKNCRITPSSLKITYDNRSLTNKKADSNDFTIATDLEPLAIRNYDCDDICLRIDSLSTGASSTIRIDQSSTAFDDIIGTAANFIEFQEPLNITRRFDYFWRDGVQGLSGYAYGYWNIKETTSQSEYANALGKRLGDCSTVNKNLTIEVDGVDYTVVFDKNYDGTASTVAPNYTNAQIIAEINAVIGSVATASEFAVAREYYPQFDGLQTRVYNDTAEIESGMGVVFLDDNEFRRATNADGKLDGICLDTVGSGMEARIITKGRIKRMSSTPSNRFEVKEIFEAPLPKPVGHEVGISATTPGLFDASASPKFLRCYEQDVYRIIK